MEFIIASIIIFLIIRWLMIKNTVYKYSEPIVPPYGQALSAQDIKDNAQRRAYNIKHNLHPTMDELNQQRVLHLPEHERADKLAELRAEVSDYEEMKLKKEHAEEAKKREEFEFYVQHGRSIDDD